ncbi:hypothetical protein BJ912DRAFT_39413 [Pholiota molesta]|nr:hypothetical protein BJ912DRAFT_39413 [Pholiota molesta]
MLDDLYWMSRSLIWGDPLFKSWEEWRRPITEDEQIQGDHYDRVLKCWEFLRPLFSERGYILYENTSERHGYINPPRQSHPVLEQGYPYGRRFSERPEDAAFIIPSCLLVWAATDKQGRDVVVKIVSESELKALQYVNTEEARSDSRNHTIRLIEHFNFRGFIFAIMPRWDQAFLNYRFKNVAQAMQCGKILLEAMDFLHEKRVFHADFYEQNIGTNVITDWPKIQPPGIRDPSSVRYAVYDFDGSEIYPLEMPLEDIWETKYAGFQLRGLPTPEGPYHPFPLDVLALGQVLERRIRHIQNLVPELGPFFDGMIDRDETRRFTARQALIEFNKIYSNLSDDQLSQPVKFFLWRKNRVV